MKMSFLPAISIGLLIFLTLIAENYGWPEGTFGLPMPKTGCPVGSDIDWETGSRGHRTEKGSHTSDNIHLAGLESKPTDHIVQLFCMKMSFPQESSHQWMPGKYCILKKGDCPAKFTAGFIYWDDAASWFGKEDSRQTSKGVLPDGEYNTNTKIYYCCRNDGVPSNAIQLPSAAPFYLFKAGDICQEVENMLVTEEWVYWSDESSHNLNVEGGVYPRIQRNKYSPVFTKLFYCYYQPKPPSQVLATMLTAVYVIAAVVGLIVMVTVLTCIVVRLTRRCRRAKRADSLSDIGVRQPSLPAGTTLVDCHYVTLQSTDITNTTTTTTTPSAPPTEYDDDGDDAILPTTPTDSRPLSFPPTYEEVVGVVPARSLPA